jgi:hypothetical protein
MEDNEDWLVKCTDKREWGKEVYRYGRGSTIAGIADELFGCIWTGRFIGSRGLTSRAVHSFPLSVPLHGLKISESPFQYRAMIVNGEKEETSRKAVFS